MNPLLAALFLGALAAACAPSADGGASGPAEPAPRAAAAEGPRSRSVPLTVNVEGPASPRAGDDVELRIRLERSSADAPASYEIALPPGVTASSGSLRGLIEAGALVVERRIVVHLDRLPEEDVTVIATTRTLSTGARARADYRFGRPEPRSAEPRRAPHETRVGPRSLGRAVLLEPRPPGP